MKIKICFLLLALSLTGPLFAQNVLDGVYVKEHTATRTPLAYPYLREADVMWSKRIWRVIDLSEKINLPLRYPESEQTRDRKSLMDVMMDAVEEGSLTAYSFQDDEFTSPITIKEIQARGYGRSKSQTARAVFAH